LNKQAEALFKSGYGKYLLDVVKKRRD
jgi:hypothetical protein